MLDFLIADAKFFLIPESMYIKKRPSLVKYEQVLPLRPKKGLGKYVVD